MYILSPLYNIVTKKYLIWNNYRWEGGGGGGGGGTTESHFNWSSIVNK